MNSDLVLSELFDHYLDNDLSAIDMQNFDLRIKKDEAFAERFRLHKEVDRAVMEDDVVSFRLKLEKIGGINQAITQKAPMIIAEELTPDINEAILEFDVMAMRNQLNRIHASVIEDLEPVSFSDFDVLEQALHAQNFAAIDEEMEEFEELAFSDNELSVLSQNIDAAVMQEDVMSLRTTLTKIGDSMLSVKRTVPLRRKVLRYASAAVAAVFVLLIGSAILFNKNSDTLASDRTFSEYFQPYDGISNKRGPSEESDRIIELGIQKYNNGDYASALELFGACTIDDNRKETVYLLSGSSLLMLGDTKKALEYFAGWDESSPTYDDIQWYTIGCFLRSNEIEKAKGILNKISLDSEHKFYNQATAILKKLRKDI